MKYLYFTKGNTMRKSVLLLSALACTACMTTTSIAHANTVCANVMNASLQQGQIPGESDYYEVIPDVDDGRDANGNVILGWNYFNPSRGEVKVTCDNVAKPALPATTSKCSLKDKTLTCQ